MKTRDILILLGLVLLILGLTIAEKYADRQRELRVAQDAATDRALWQQRMNNALDKRWEDLSSGLRKALDSMATDVVAGGVPRDSLAAVILDSTFAGPPAPKSSQSAARKPAPSDTLARAVLREYDKGITALPADLTAYERRVAVNEVVSMVRARFGLTPGQFDSLLKQGQAKI